MFLRARSKACEKSNGMFKRLRGEGGSERQTHGSRVWKEKMGEVGLPVCKFATVCSNLIDANLDGWRVSGQGFIAIEPC